MSTEIHHANVGCDPGLSMFLGTPCMTQVDLHRDALPGSCQRTRPESAPPHGSGQFLLVFMIAIGEPSIPDDE
jgi:hypothetical protein